MCVLSIFLGMQNTRNSCDDFELQSFHGKEVQQLVTCVIKVSNQSKWRNLFGLTRKTRGQNVQDLGHEVMLLLLVLGWEMNTQENSTGSGKWPRHSFT